MSKVESTKKIISIDGKLKVETAEEKKRNTIITLNESAKSGKILTGQISGVERLGKKGPAIAVIYMNDYNMYAIY